tara:strand:- start:14046 stop:14825 length:780 start_codon:yes stop_codon:yes gene_type:complete
MSALRMRILNRDCVVGTFVKTPALQVVELLGRAGLDFAIADMEHAPIDLSSLDGMALGARSAGLPLLIRSTGAQPAAIWPALDLGCAGVMVPHVASAADASAVAQAVKYALGSRGFSPSGRAGDYGCCDHADYRRRSDAGSVIMAQIEDASALDNLDAIAAVPEVDVLFIGPADLSLSLGCATDAPPMLAAIDAVIAAAKRAGKASGIYVGAASQMRPWADKGMTVFVCGSDQSMILNGARGLKQTARDLMPPQSSGAG